MREGARAAWEDEPVKYAEHILDLVGNTPLVKLNSVTDGIAATVLARSSTSTPAGP
jgi:cystathionine beta-synthase